MRKIRIILVCIEKKLSWNELLLKNGPKKVKRKNFQTNMLIVHTSCKYKKSNQDCNEKLLILSHFFVSSWYTNEQVHPVYVNIYACKHKINFVKSMIIYNIKVFQNVKVKQKYTLGFCKRYKNICVTLQSHKQ